DDRSLLPHLHRALAVLVLIGAGMGWLIFYNYESPPTGPTKNVPPQVAEKAAAKDAKPVIDGDRAKLALAVPPAASSANEPTLPHASVPNGASDTTRSMTSGGAAASSARLGETARNPNDAPMHVPAPAEQTDVETTEAEAVNLHAAIPEPVKTGAS